MVSNMRSVTCPIGSRRSAPSLHARRAALAARTALQVFRPLRGMVLSSEHSARIALRIPSSRTGW